MSSLSSLEISCGGVRVKTGSSRAKILLSFSGVSNERVLWTFPTWILKPLFVLKLSSQWLHLKTVSVVTGGNTGSVADEFEDDEITGTVDDEVAADAGAAVLARAAWCLAARS